MQLTNAAIAGTGFALGHNRPAGPGFLAEDYILGADSLRHLDVCPANWKSLGADGDLKIGVLPFAAWAATLMPERMTTLVAVRPETYTKQVLKCPICGSVSTSVHCKKDDVDRVLTKVSYQWSRNAVECKAWEDVAVLQGKVLISTIDYGRVLSGAQALQLGSGVGTALENGSRGVALTGRLDDENGHSFPVSELIAVLPGEQDPESNCIYLLGAARNTGPGPIEISSYIGTWCVRGALALDLLNSATAGVRNTVRILVASTSDQPEPAYCQLTPPAIASGRATYLRGAEAYLRGLAYDEWPGFDRAGDNAVTWRALDPALF